MTVFGRIEMCLYRLIKALKPEGLLEVLRTVERIAVAAPSQANDEKALSFFIASEVCIEFQVDKKDLFHRNYQAASEARACLFFLIEESTSFNIKEAATLFGIEYSQAYKCHKRMEKYFDVAKYQPALQSKYTRIKDKITLYKNLKNE